MFRRLSFALIFLLTISAANAADIRFPELTGRVVDNAHIIDANVAQQIDSQIAAHEQKTSDQIVVVTIPDLNDVAIEDYGYRLGRAWGIGQKGKNNGVLLIVAPKEHRVRIEVGYGLEGVLTDAASSVIINRIITPAFKHGDFSGGIQQGVTAIIDTIGGTNVNDLKPKDGNQGDNTHLLILLFVFIVFLHWMLRGRGVIGPFAAGWFLGSGLGGNDDDDSGGGFSGGGGSFGGGGSSGSW
jgi:uncharacterized protein